MGRRGRKRRLAVEDEYWRLMGSGVGTVEACRRVGIGRHTGYRWRAEHGGMPPARLAHEVSGRCLSLLERERIATLRRMGMGVRQMAREIRCDRRLMLRRSWPGVFLVWRPLPDRVRP